MSTTTTNYGLHQWAPEDSFLRSDFNEDNAKIDAAIMAVKSEIAEALNGYKASVDAALGQMAKLATGTYVGTGAVPLAIEVGFRPKFLAIFAKRGNSNGEETMTLMGMEGAMIRHPYGYGSSHTVYSAHEFTDTGFILHDGGDMNTSGRTYYYTAIG